MPLARGVEVANEVVLTLPTSSSMWQIARSGCCHSRGESTSCSQVMSVAVNASLLSAGLRMNGTCKEAWKPSGASEQKRRHDAAQGSGGTPSEGRNNWLNAPLPSRPILPADHLPTDSKEVALAQGGASLTGSGCSGYKSTLIDSKRWWQREVQTCIVSKSHPSCSTNVFGIWPAPGLPYLQ